MCLQQPGFWRPEPEVRAWAGPGPPEASVLVCGRPASPRVLCGCLCPDPLFCDPTGLGSGPTPATPCYLNPLWKQLVSKRSHRLRPLGLSLLLSPAGAEVPSLSMAGGREGELSCRGRARGGQGRRERRWQGGPLAPQGPARSLCPFGPPLLSALPGSAVTRVCLPAGGGPCHVSTGAGIDGRVGSRIFQKPHCSIPCQSLAIPSVKKAGSVCPSLNTSGLCSVCLRP